MLQFNAGVALLNHCLRSYFRPIHSGMHSWVTCIWRRKNTLFFFLFWKPSKQTHPIFCTQPELIVSFRWFWCPLCVCVSLLNRHNHISKQGIQTRVAMIEVHTQMFLFFIKSTSFTQVAVMFLVQLLDLIFQSRLLNSHGWGFYKLNINYWNVVVVWFFVCQEFVACFWISMFGLDLN